PPQTRRRVVQPCGDEGPGVLTRAHADQQRPGDVERAADREPPDAHHPPSADAVPGPIPARAGRTIPAPAGHRSEVGSLDPPTPPAPAKLSPIASGAATPRACSTVAPRSANDERVPRSYGPREHPATSSGVRSREWSVGGVVGSHP